MIKIDARGLSCPEPLTLLVNALNSGKNEYQIIVDQHSAKENIIRYCLSNGYTYSVDEGAPDIFITVLP